MKNDIHNKNLVNIKDMKYIYKKVHNNDPKVGIDKIKIKTWFVYFFKCPLNL